MRQGIPSNPLDLLSFLNEIVKNQNSKISYIYNENYGYPDLGSNIKDMNLLEELKNALINYGIIKLYKFQQEAIESILKNNDTVISAGTATGKTEAFLIPILNLLKNNSEERALFIYPTKSLERDQISRISSLSKELGVSFGIIDGDTPPKERTEIYKNTPQILISNPDMIHLGLSLSSEFRNALKNLKFVVIDEMHIYKGIFGSHMKWILYRLSKLSNEDVLFIGSGATIGNPEEMGERLFGRKVKVIYGPKRRKGTALHIFIDHGYMSRWTFSSYIISSLIKKGLKVLAFTDSQQMSELISKISRKNYNTNVLVHRAGLSAETRKKVENDIKEGLIKGVVSTSTLELGIDIGDLDAIVMTSLPKSYSSYLQRAGRAGRRGNPGLVITIMGDDPIESFYLNNPEKYFSQEPDPGYIEPRNKEVLKLHFISYLLQKGFIKKDDIPEEFLDVVDDLLQKGFISIINNIYHPSWKEGRNFILNNSIRSTGPIVKIYYKNKNIGYREMPQALYELHPNAIYYHSGETYLSIRLDVNSYRAEVIKLNDVHFYTKPLYNIDVIEVIPKEKRLAGIIPITYGDLHIMIQVEGYVVKDEYSGSIISTSYYEKPIKWDYWTKGILTKYPELMFESGEKKISSYHALEHVLISASRPIIGASDTDLGGISYPSGHIVIYDSSIGGHGGSKLVFDRFEKVEGLALKIVSSCNCEDGCPRCVFSPYCGNNNQYLSRKGALSLLKYVFENKEAKNEEEKPLGKPLA
ncbi:DEAD/DEAH box helicase [Caldisphaera sp.]|uniref:DEAD/DEAH box helicase n=1 Tax=Caldisphaera sp. TaxID=2060322 RepID=UPI0025C06B12|nr:DEAD/DEAH box helicase [Caldisphaera sp.]